MKLLALLALLPSLALATNTGQPSGGGHHGGYQGGHPGQIINDVNGGRGGMGGEGGLGGNGYGGQGGVGVAPGGIIQGGRGGQGGTIAPGAVQNRVGANAVGTGYGGSNSLVIEGAPANQRIEYVSVPSLGTQFIPPAVNCYPAAAAQGVGMGGGGSITASFYSLPCHWQSLANTTASIGVAAINSSVPLATDTPQIQQAAQQARLNGLYALVDAQHLLRGTDINYYLLAKAQGRVPPIRPDRGIGDAWLGGLVSQHVLENPDYIAPRPVVYHAPAYVPPNPPDKALDNYFQNEMKK